MLDENAVDIRFEKVSKIYKGNENPSIKDISLNISAGSLVVILGPSGCGKTTLLKTVNRLIEPSSGSIYLNDIDNASIQQTDLRRRIGYVIQQVGLFPHMTIRKNISVVLDLLHWEEARINRRVIQLMDMIGLSLNYLEKYPRHLSGGEQQRIGLIRAMAADPGILLMDEPFGSIDAINRAALQSELLEIQSKLKKTILLVTHDVEEAFILADKILIIRDGKRIQFGDPLKIATNPQNRFISELVGTDDLLRRLSLLKVSYLIKNAEFLNSPGKKEFPDISSEDSVGLEDDLRKVVIKLLGSDTDQVGIVNQTGNLIGSLTFKDLISFSRKLDKN